MTTDWTRGYASDIDYTRGWYRELSPLWLDTALALAGVAPPQPAEHGPVWLELGCGHGLSALALAAARPDMTVIAVDFNPTHIHGAQRLAQAAGLANIRLMEADFAELAEDTTGLLPPLDYVALHGVYTWVGMESRGHIARLITRRLKPGGAVYLSYNCLPGWAAAMPVQFLLNAYGQALPGPKAAAGDQARDLLLHLLNQGAGYFTGNAAASARADRLRGATAPYLVHEYMHSGWQPAYHAQVADHLAAAKLSYAGSAAWVENFPDLMMTRAQQDMAAAAPTRALAETVKDYVTNQPLRRDVFVRGPLALDARQRVARLGALRLVALGEPGAALPDFALPLGAPDPEVSRLFHPVLAVLAGGPATLADLVEHLARAMADWGPDSAGHLLRALAILVAGDVLAPCLADAQIQAALPGVRRLNRALLADSLMTGATLDSEIRLPERLASAVTGGGVMASVEEMGALAAHWAGQVVMPPDALSRLARLGVL
ncbi:class I SAM-dependent methyltransferase [Nitrospirillum sp. BR 11163]|uniref:class I SAM-dependent methyltransferase n=1 Tax=Nitrospirillum sp. BR 11163 TaxID=3104323 RepID=UPI002AFE8A9C|nr:class I SAM-dependent methyltransferase [Nitrospirillum sp. BR 11163]MEA1674360.1 class I SAM-dependent methyltransferase [Nitrospirillum sp. BR 11163]